MKDLVKRYAKMKGVKLYEIAARLGIWPSKLSEQLRHDLSDAEVQRIMQAADAIAAERGTK